MGSESPVHDVFQTTEYEQDLQQMLQFLNMDKLTAEEMDEENAMGNRDVLSREKMYQSTQTFTFEP
jgi:hypothetical protein